VSGKGKRIAGAAVAAVALMVSAGAAQAQSTGAENTPEDQQRLSQGIRSANQAAAESYLRNLSEGPEVTFEQVMADPDNAALNAAYARTQIAHGDLLGASVTLERLLLSHPEATEARLIYGVVLYRLDDIVTARDVLQGLDPNELTADHRAERERILSMIDQRRKRLRQTFTLAVGEHFDTDRNASPNAGSMLVDDLTFTLNGDARARKDWGTLTVGAYEAEYDLGTDPRLAIYGGASALSDTQARLKTLNNQTGGLSTGLKFQDGSWDVSGGLFWNSMDLQSDYYLSDWGVNSRVSYRLDERWSVFDEARLSFQAFHDVPADSLGHQNSGTVPSNWLGLNWKPVQSHILSSSIGVTHRYAEATAMSNTRLAGRLSDTWLLGQGQFLTTQGEYGGAVYDAPNSTISSSITRRDRDIRLNMTYGVPTGTVYRALGGGELPDEIKDVVVAGTVEYYHEMSTLINYTYSNIRTQVVASKRWEF
jgi:hypothetical protein